MIGKVSISHPITEICKSPLEAEDQARNAAALNTSNMDTRP